MTFREWARDLWICHMVTCWRHMINGWGVNQCLKHNMIWPSRTGIELGGSYYNKEYRG